MSNTVKTLIRLLRDASGAVIVLVAVALPVFLLMLAWVIDIGLVRLTGHRLQITASAAALAGASQLPDNNDVRTQALLYSGKNYAAINGHPVLKAADIETGNWDGSVFVAGAKPKNAVRATARRTNANENPLQSIFAMFAGINEFEISRSAVAESEPGKGCKSGGFFSAEEVLSGSDNDYTEDFCLYGDDGVKIGSDNTVSPGTTIAMNDLSDFEQGGENGAVEDSLMEAEYDLELPGLVSGIVDDMQNGLLNEMPDFITNGPVYLNEITDVTPLIPNTLYIVEEVADLGSDRVISDIAIVAKKEIKVGSDVTLSNVVFATEDKILFGSDNVIGSLNYCSDGTYNIYLYSGDNIEFGSDNYFRGAQMGARGELKLGSDVAGIKGVHAEATGKIDYGSADTFGSCGGGLASDFGDLEFPVGTQFALVR
ncbi:pilus assembly protein TadG-related protein [Candidatus Halocynthiibacter alkanivorans]|uniref:pilus assembly protein TadG-related protein n=1 Tax=Candidatus Halocynthiibacter alkanivorans TaxID=2267619 RepID=UPI00135C0C8A|nr:pilus assembly protein TadG-related protein [Candidatus Halocynthiibacter alkanivorans]